MPRLNLCAIGLTAWQACSVSPDLPLPQEKHWVPLGLDLHVVQISSEEAGRWMLVDIILEPCGLVEYLKMNEARDVMLLNGTQVCRMPQNVSCGTHIELPDRLVP